MKLILLFYIINLIFAYNFYYCGEGNSIDSDLSSYLDGLISAEYSSSSSFLSIDCSDSQNLKNSVKEIKNSIIFGLFTKIKDSEIESTFKSTSNVVFIITTTKTSICANNIISYSNEVVAAGKCIFLLFFSFYLS